MSRRPTGRSARPRLPARRRPDGRLQRPHRRLAPRRPDHVAKSRGRARGRRRRAAPEGRPDRALRLQHRLVMSPGALILAHVAGAPVEEMLLTLAPVLSLGGWAYLRGLPERGGRPFARKRKRPQPATRSRVRSKWGKSPIDRRGARERSLSHVNGSQSRNPLPEHRRAPEGAAGAGRARDHFHRIKHPASGEVLRVSTNPTRDRVASSGRRHSTRRGP